MAKKKSISNRSTAPTMCIECGKHLPAGITFRTLIDESGNAIGDHCFQKCKLQWEVTSLWNMRFSYRGTNDKQSVSVAAVSGEHAKNLAMAYFIKVFGKEEGSKFAFDELISRQDVVQAVYS